MGAATKAATDAEDAHDYSCFVSCSSAVIVTSVARAGSPLGSGLFQLTPNLSRATTASSFRPKRSPP